MGNERVPEVRFAGFNGDWIEHKLKEVFEQTTNYINPKEEFVELWSLTVENGLTPKTNRYNRGFLVKKEDKFKSVSPNEFIYNPMNMTLGAVDLNLTGKKVAVSGYYITMMSKKGYDSKYFGIWLKSPLAIRNYKIYATGSLIERQRVQFPTLSQIKTLVPSENEQIQIGGLFKNLDDTITLHQQELTTLKQTKQGFLQKMFPKEGESVPEVRFPGFIGDWEQRRLGDITKTSSGGTPSVGNKSFYGGDIPFIRSAEINSEGTELFITEEALNKSSTKMVGKGDILYALYGATSGEVGISKINGAINQAVLVIKPKFDDNPYYIVQWLKKQKFRVVNSFLQGGQGNLSGSIVRKLIITTPPNIDEQIKIGDFFKQLDDTIALHQRELTTLKQTKKAFLQKMFV